MMESNDFDEYHIDNDLLISLVGQKPLLWDRNQELYKNRVETQAAWEEIVSELNPDFETKEAKRKVFAKLVIQRWTHIRDSFYRSYKKILEQRKLGKRVTKPYVYSKQLSFLPTSNLQNNEASNESQPIENCSTNGESEESDNEQTENDEQEVNFIDCSNAAKQQTIIRKCATPQSMKRPMNNDVNHDEAKMIKIIDTRLISTNNCKPTPNRHLSFFHGILPTLDKFDDDQVLEFQMGVLQLLKDIKHSYQNNEAASFSGNL